MELEEYSIWSLLIDVTIVLLLLGIVYLIWKYFLMVSTTALVVGGVYYIWHYFKEDVTGTEKTGLVIAIDVNNLKETFMDKQSWCKQLSFRKRHEWLVDCYRLRLDDDYVWGGGYLHGLYDPDIQMRHEKVRKVHIIKDFLIFMKLAVANGVIPKNSKEFRFEKCLKVAQGLLCYAFEKSDATEKWRGENVFSVGPSLRRTAEYVYGTSCMESCFTDNNNNEAHNIQKKIENEVEVGLKLKKFEHSSRAIFEDVGSLSIWIKLFKEMSITPSHVISDFSNIY